MAVALGIPMSLVDLVGGQFQVHVDDLTGIEAELFPGRSALRRPDRSVPSSGIRRSGIPDVALHERGCSGLSVSVAG